VRDPAWGYFVLGIITYQIAKMLWQISQKELTIRREKKFIKQLRIELPDSGQIALITVQSSDKKAIKDLERQLREQTEPRSA
jgi:hypothetical protein